MVWANWEGSGVTCVLMNLPRIGIPPVPREDIQYASFADEINEQAAAKFIHWMDLISLDSNPRQTAIHMLFNSTGGSIVDALNMRGYVGAIRPTSQSRCSTQAVCSPLLCWFS